MFVGLVFGFDLYKLQNTGYEHSWNGSLDRPSVVEASHTLEMDALNVNLQGSAAHLFLKKQISITHRCIWWVWLGTT
jgi:hypothetical protein